MEALEKPTAADVTIAVAPNGGRRMKSDHPAIPTTPAELARTAAACREAGAAMIHLHVRDADGRHLLDAAAYRDATAAVRTAVGDRMVIQVTSESLGQYSPAEQMAVIRETRPEAVSLALRELAPGEDHVGGFADFLGWLAHERIAPQVILYAPEDVVRLAAMIERGAVPFRSIPVLYVLGRYTPGQKSKPSDLLPFLAPGLPAFEHWMLCAFGAREIACATAAGLMGGHARVGFENNLRLPHGDVAPDNASLVAATARALAAVGLRPGDATALRAGWDACRG